MCRYVGRYVLSQNQISKQRTMTTATVCIAAMNGYSNNNNLLVIIKVLFIVVAAVSLPLAVCFGYVAPPRSSSCCIHKRCHRWRAQDTTTNLVRYKIHQLHMATGKGGDELKVTISDDDDNDEENNADIDGGSSSSPGCEDSFKQSDDKSKENTAIFTRLFIVF